MLTRLDFRREFAKNPRRRTKSEYIPLLPTYGTAMPTSLATLRSKIESALRGRVSSPFTSRDRNVFDLVPTGIPEIDALVAALPRGAMTEICGTACSGRSSLLLSAVASRTAQGEGGAVVDARGGF